MLRFVDEHVPAADNKPLILTGESGCGKSALIAEWVARWQQENPDDFVIQHYIGSTAGSTDWQGIVRRILAELKRAFNIAIPLQANALRTALNDWFVKTAGSRLIVLVLDALNQLSGDDATAHQLGWLPVIVPANVRLLVSTLPGQTLDALRRRGWHKLDVPLFSRTEIVPVATAYVAIFGRKLPREILTKLEATPAACNALFLRAVLDEQRQFGKHEQLKAKAADYLSALDLPALFDRILTRWHDDFANDPEHPDLVRRSLCLIGCARFGLSERELLDLLGEEDQPLPPAPGRPSISPPRTPWHCAAACSISATIT